MSLIELRDIRKSYRAWEQEIPVLKWISLDIEEWSFLSIMGASWWGKSTLMNIIWMLDNPSSGTYFFRWEDVSTLTDDEQSMIRRQNIGFIFQTYNLIPRVSVLKQVMLPLMYQWVPAKERKERAIRALQKVWIEAKMNNLPTELSGGQQQRVSIARAMVTEPKFILGDEPTGALDSNTSKEVMDLICGFHEEGKTIILITHDKWIDSYAKQHVFVKDGLTIN